jgi:hypothetical protein
MGAVFYRGSIAADRCGSLLYPDALVSPRSRRGTGHAVFPILSS